MIINNVRLDNGVYNIVINGGKITAVTTDATPRGLNAAGKTVIAGLIDVHTHGRNNIDTMDADFKALKKAYAKVGTTSFLPTTMTADINDVRKVTYTPTDGEGANILGFHLEGPYIAASRKGAQDERSIRKPDVSEFRSMKNVKMITVAPEVENAIPFIKEVSNECVVSLGHTDADCDTALSAIDAGALCLTHTFNAMPPLLHRAPSVIGAAVERNIYAQIICDGLHVSRQAVIAAYRMFGALRMVLISDSIRCAGCDDGEYICGGLQVTLKNNEARLSDGTLAGSCASLLDCVKTAVRFGIPKNDAVRMATLTPAELLGLKTKGKIAEGYDADLLILDENFDLETVIIGGEVVYKFKEQ